MSRFCRVHTGAAAWHVTCEKRVVADEFVWGTCFALCFRTCVSRCVALPCSVSRLHPWACVWVGVVVGPSSGAFSFPLHLVGVRVYAGTNACAIRATGLGLAWVPTRDMAKVIRVRFCHRCPEMQVTKRLDALCQAPHSAHTRVFVVVGSRTFVRAHTGRATVDASHTRVSFRAAHLRN